MLGDHAKSRLNFISESLIEANDIAWEEMDQYRYLYLSQ